MKEISLDGIRLVGIEVDLPDSPPLILIRGNRSFAMCGFLNIEAADRAGVLAIMSSGVNSVEDLLEAPVKGTTSRALEMGAKMGEKVSESLRRIEME
ncbi:MAG: DUF1805 domain-containing protein [Candidatus Korarchaeota archaeon]|nr:DUF1805 domain-containing protein [Candidatus Korarchaeota archaeon]